MYRTAEQIDEIILVRIAAGSRPADIASVVDKPAAWVWERMAALGLDNEPNSHLNKYSVHPMWGLDEQDRRMALWQRQHDGAVATLARHL